MIKKIKYEVNDFDNSIKTKCEIRQTGVGGMTCQENCMHHICIDKSTKTVTCGFIKTGEDNPSPSIEMNNENTNF